MHDLTPLHGLLGGALIGLAAAALMLFTGRLAGVSGILGGLLTSRSTDRAWRIAFVAGLIAAPILAALAGAPLPRPAIATNLALVAAAGLLVGSAAGWEMAVRRVTVSAASHGVRHARSWRPSFSWAPPSSRSQSSVMDLEDRMPLVLASFACGLVFGAGLLISGMTEPDKVLGFLDIFGAWDATLAFVMAGAVAVSSVGFALAQRRAAPLFASGYLWPTRRDIDAPLVTGAVLFGVGWGLVGICPGPALVNLAGLSLPIVVFVGAMVIGMLGYEFSPARGGTSVAAVESPAVASRTDG